MTGRDRSPPRQQEQDDSKQTASGSQQTASGSQQTTDGGGAIPRATASFRTLNINADPWHRVPPPDGNQGNEFLAAAVSSSLNLPSFWLERPHTWFAMCESTFAVRQITSPITQYHHCVRKLPQETVASIEDVVNNFTAFNDPYRELKERLCRAYGRTDQQKVNDLLDLPPLGVEKPSVLMDNILSLWPDVTTKMTSMLLRGMFLRRLPEQMRAQLANYQAISPGDLAAAADAIWAQYGGKFPAAAAAEATVAAATTAGHRDRSNSPGRNNFKGGNRGRSSHRHNGGRGGQGGRHQTPGNKKPPQNPSWCWKHNKFGAACYNCDDPRTCTYPN